jgi:hypothetical protein
VRDEARAAALERNALATGTGVTLGTVVAADVVVTIGVVATIEVAVGAREVAVSEVMVLFVGWMDKSGKNTAAAAAKAEGRRMALFLF